MSDTENPPPREYRQTRFARPPGSTEIILVRHGESEPLVPGKPFPLVGGHGDPALAPEGRAQAERLALRLAHEHFDAIYVTTLRRTHETIAPLAARLGITPVVEADLREVHLGDWEGELYRQKAAEQAPEIVTMIAEQRWDAIPGAEPMDRLRARVRAGMERIITAHRDGRVVVVAHGGVIAEVMAQATEAPNPFTFLGVDNASITHLVAVGPRWIVRRFNDTAHLEIEFADVARDTPALDPTPAPIES